MANAFKSYKNILGNPVIASGANANTFAIPIRGAQMVVARLRSATLESVACSAPNWTLGGLPATGATFVSIAGQGYSLIGTTPATLASGPAAWALVLVSGASAVGALLPSYYDWCRMQFTLGAQVNNGVLDVEVWYDGDPDYNLYSQLGTRDYTPVP